MKVYGGAADVDTETKLTIAIADFIHSCGLAFRLADHPKFRKMIMIARLVTSKYKFPDRNQIGTKLLDINYNTYMDEAKEQLEKDIKIFGLSFYGDGATVRKMPLINVLASGAYINTVVLEIINCTEHMQAGLKKDAEYIANVFKPHIQGFETKNPNCVDYCTFDGAANVQKAGRVLSATYPRIICTHGAEQPCYLFVLPRYFFVKDVKCFCKMFTENVCDFWERCDACTVCNTSEVQQNLQ